MSPRCNKNANITITALTAWRKHVSLASDRQMMSQRRRYLVSRLNSQLFANKGRHRADVYCRGGFLIICPAADCATAVITTGDQSICACALSRTRQLERSAATGRSDILIVNVKTNMSFSALKWVDK